MNMRALIFSVSVGATLSMVTGPALADCQGLPSWSALKNALVNAIQPATGANGGLGFNMWATIVANDGRVCAVAFSGAHFTSQWLGSRAISAQKANAANAFSLGHGATPPTSAFAAGLSLSTANLYSAVQPGGSLYGLQTSNPIDTLVAYGNFEESQGNKFAPADSLGSQNDPMVGLRVGGVNVFGGGLALFQGGVKVGGVGVSGDTSCTDHMVAWRVRSALGFDQFAGVGGVSGDAAHPDNIIFDIKPNPNGGAGISAGGFGHPTCLNTPTAAALKGLPAVH